MFGNSPIGNTCGHLCQTLTQALRLQLTFQTGKATIDRNQVGSLATVAKAIQKLLDRKVQPLRATIQRTEDKMAVGEVAAVQRHIGELPGEYCPNFACRVVFPFRKFVPASVVINYAEIIVKAAEFARTREAVLAVRDSDRLLAGDRRLAQSIRLRNPYVDPLSLLQVDLLARWRAGERRDDALFQALVSTVNGIAAGVQNTG